MTRVQSHAGTQPRSHEECASSFRWVNALPAEIAARARELTAGQRLCLQTIADAGTRQKDGSISGAIGGQPLWRRCGISERTWWRAIKRLEELGLIVLLSRGGTVALRGAHASYSKQAANVYAIPASVGAMDARRVPREMATMVRDGRQVRRVVTRPGEQASWWDAGDSTPLAKCQYPTGKMSVSHLSLPSPWSGNDTMAPGGGGFSAKKPQRHKDTQPRRGNRGPLHVEREDLADDERLFALRGRWEKLGKTTDGEADMLWFFAAASHALRVGQDPPALFAAMMQRDLRLYITQADEDAGRKLLKKMFGEE